MQVIYNVEYDGRTPLYDSPAPKAVTGCFECPAWTQPGPADKDKLIYDEMLTACGYRFVYGSLGDPGGRAESCANLSATQFFLGCLHSTTCSSIFRVNIWQDPTTDQRLSTYNLTRRT